VTFAPCPIAPGTAGRPPQSGDMTDDDGSCVCHTLPMVASSSWAERPEREPAPSLGRALWRWLRVVVLAGVPTGLVIGGAGSRLAMLALRATSSPSVIGVTSDDGFSIGRFTLSGTYNLLQLGAFVGLVGATAYLLVRPWLLGPAWFGDLTVGLGSGAVVGSMLLHADGVDFRLLTPRWFAMGLFVALPAAFGVAIGPAVRTVEGWDRPTGWRQLVAPAIVLVLGPGALVASVVVVRRGHGDPVPPRPAQPGGGSADPGLLAGPRHRRVGVARSRCAGDRCAAVIPGDRSGVPGQRSGVRRRAVA
jgi:hypothetical protein